MAFELVPVDVETLRNHLVALGVTILRLSDHDVGVQQVADNLGAALRAMISPWRAGRLSLGWTSV